jgi:Helicase associated domain
MRLGIIIQMNLVKYSSCHSIAQTSHFILLFSADVKKLVAEFRENAKKLKRKEQRKIQVLEAKVAKIKAAADEASQKVAAAPPSPLPPTSPPVAEPAAAKLKPPQEKTWKSVATFEERIQELEHFRKGNGHVRVPLRQPGLGRWVGELRTIYKSVQAGATGTILSPGTKGRTSPCMG